MAKRKKAPRRRVGSIARRGGATKSIANMLSMGGGAVIGGMLGSVIDKAIPDTVDQKIVAFGKMAAGYLIGTKMSGGNPILHGVGIGLVANGGSDLAKGVGLLSGVYDYVTYAAGASQTCAPQISPTYGNTNYVAGGFNNRIMVAGVGYQGNPPLG